MILINAVLTMLITLIDKVMPVFGLPDEFYQKVDEAIVLLIQILRMGSYILPLDVMVYCLGIMLVADNLSVLTWLGKYVIRLVRG